MPRNSRLTAGVRHAVECLKNPESICATVNIYGEGTLCDQDGCVLLEKDLETASRILRNHKKHKNQSRRSVAK